MTVVTLHSFMPNSYRAMHSNIQFKNWWIVHINPKRQTVKNKILEDRRNKDWRVRVNSFLSEPELTHGVCVEFIWLGTGMIFSVKNQEVKNGVVICAWQKLRAFPWGPLPPCWPQGSLLLQHPLTLWDHTSTPAAGIAHTASPRQLSVCAFSIGLPFVKFLICASLCLFLFVCLQKQNHEATHRGR